VGVQLDPQAWTQQVVVKLERPDWTQQVQVQAQAQVLAQE
jgi:hypothetical protein